MSSSTSDKKIGLRMGRIELSAVLMMPVSERLRLVEAIWDSHRRASGCLPLSDAEREELDRRWAAYVKNPTAGAPWGKVKKRITARRCRGRLS
jgi:putative addiction module component (TIGR02574 family)